MYKKNVADDFVVIKFGTKCFIDNGNVRQEVLEQRVADVRHFIEEGVHPILVVSGAVSMGKAVLQERMEKMRAEISMGDVRVKQAYAAAGQMMLMDMYRHAFGDTPVAQILITYNNLNTRRDEINITQRLFDFKDLGIIPLINYNDPVDASEVAQNNDIPGAMIAEYVWAKTYLNVSNVDGLLDREGKVVREVTGLDSAASLCNSASKDGNGGMKTKVDAARIVLGYGGRMIIGNVSESLNDLFECRKGTVFYTPTKKSLGLQ